MDLTEKLSFNLLNLGKNLMSKAKENLQDPL